MGQILKRITNRKKKSIGHDRNYHDPQQARAGDKHCDREPVRNATVFQQDGVAHAGDPGFHFVFAHEQFVRELGGHTGNGLYVCDAAQYFADFHHGHGPAHASRGIHVRQFPAGVAASEGNQMHGVGPPVGAAQPRATSEFVARRNGLRILKRFGTAGLASHPSLGAAALERDRHDSSFFFFSYHVLLYGAYLLPILIISRHLMYAATLGVIVVL